MYSPHWYIDINNCMISKEKIEQKKNPKVKLLSSVILDRYYFVPVEPNPPLPRSVSVSSSTTLNDTVRCGAITI